MSIEITLPVDDRILRKAIELRMSDVFPAMNIANALGGYPSKEWDLCRRYNLTTLVAEALDRLLPVADFQCEVTKKKFMECKSYSKVRDELGGRSDFPK